MKSFKMHYSPIKPGYKRETIIELNYKELDGLHQVITESLKYANQDKKILLDFQNSKVTDSPSIQCIYYNKDESEE